MVQTALRALRYQLKLQKFSLRVRFTRKDRVIRADADAVVDALINILSNAMKYSVERKHIVVSTYRRNNYVAVSVQDRGVGISQKDLSHIFDPYFRSRDEMTKGIGGVGLGLSVVQHVMNAHGGKVEVSSSLGKGTTFTLLFPTEVRGEAYPRDRR